MTDEQLLEMVPGWLARGLDVRKQLERPGVLDSAQLERLRATSAPSLSKPIRAKLASRLRANGPLTVRVAPLAPARPDVPLPPGTYDLSVALRLALVNDTLARLYTVYTIPHTIRDSSLATVFPIDQLRQVLVGSPDGVSLGALRLTAAPTVSALADLAEPLFSVPVARCSVSFLPAVSTYPVMGFVSL